MAVGGRMNHRMNLAAGFCQEQSHSGVRRVNRRSDLHARVPVTLKIEIEVRSVSEAVRAASGCGHVAAGSYGAV